MSVIILGKYEGYSEVLLTDITSTYTNRIFQLSVKDTLGNDTELLRDKATLLTAYYQILVDYLNPVDNDDENFFDETGIMDILEHFNNLANSSIYTVF